MNLLALAEAQFEQTVADRRFLHQFPELSGEEDQTAAFLKAKLEELGFLVEANLGGNGLIGHFDGGNVGKKLLMRFDMDALPVSEENDFPHRSQHQGVMHACGHDGHMAIGLTIARMIRELAPQLNGTVHLLFQPAEEIGTGALAMVADGVLERIEPDYILGAHLWNEKLLGWLGIKEGPLMASSSVFEIVIRGKGGHGGRPQLANDPIVAAAQLVNQLQLIVSRNLSPFEPAVLSVCSIEGGNSYNVIPSLVKLKGTVRTFDEETYRLLKDRMTQFCMGIGLASGCEINLEMEALVEPTTNHPEVARAMQRAALKLDTDVIVDQHYQTMMSEDIGVFLEQVPGCFVLVGAGSSPDGNQYGHHHPMFDFDERAMPLTAALLWQTGLELAESSR